MKFLFNTKDERVAESIKSELERLKINYETDTAFIVNGRNKDELDSIKLELKRRNIQYETANDTQQNKSISGIVAIIIIISLLTFIGIAKINGWFGFHSILDNST